MQQKELNPDHIINTLANEIANASIKSAKQNAVIIELSKQVEELKKDNENLKEQLASKEKNNKQGSNAKKK